jgi:hypothetical protein
MDAAGDESEHTGVELAEARTQVQLAVGAERVLGQVVGSQAHEIDDAREGVQVHRHGRQLHHHPQRRQPQAPAARLTLEQAACRQHLVPGADHREHHAQIRMLRGDPEQCPDLGPMKAFVGQPEPDSTPSQRGVGLVLGRQIGKCLVRTGVQGPDHHRVWGHGPAGGRVLLGLALLGRRPLPAQEQQLGAKEPDPGRPPRGGELRGLGRADVGHEPQRGLLDPQPPGVAQSPAGGDAGGQHPDLAAATVHLGSLVARGRLDRARGTQHRGNPQLAGHDGQVGGRAAELGHHAQQELRLDAQQLGGGELAGDHDRGLHKPLQPRAVNTGQLGHEQPSDLAHVGRAFPQIGVLQLLQLLRVAFGGGGSRLRGGGAAGHQGVDRALQGGVAQHHRLGVEHVRRAGGLTAPPFGELLQPHGHVLGRLLGRLRTACGGCLSGSFAGHEERAAGPSGRSGGASKENPALAH